MSVKLNKLFSYDLMSVPGFKSASMNGFSSLKRLDEGWYICLKDIEIVGTDRVINKNDKIYLMVYEEGMVKTENDDWLDLSDFESLTENRKKKLSKIKKPLQ